jgi:hypothetical protein
MEKGPFLLYIAPDHCVAVRKGLRLDVRLVSVTAFHFVAKAEVVGL